MPWSDISQTSQDPNDPRLVFLGTATQEDVLLFTWVIYFLLKIIFVKYTHILFGRSHNSTSPIGHCDVFAMLHSSIFLPSKCFMHLRIYQGTKYYADTGKRYRDSSNRRRAGFKHLGHVSFTFGFILSDFVLYIWYPFVCSGTRGPRQTECRGSSRELRCMPFRRQLTSSMLRRFGIVFERGFLKELQKSEKN